MSDRSFVRRDHRVRQDRNRRVRNFREVVRRAHRQNPVEDRRGPLVRVFPDRRDRPGRRPEGRRDSSP